MKPASNLLSHSRQRSEASSPFAGLARPVAAPPAGYAPAPPVSAPGHMSLASFLARIGQAVRSISREWVIAELESVKAAGAGHLYLDLVGSETTPDGRTTKVASARATIWKNASTAILAKFERGTGRKLAQGMTVLLRVEPNFHAQFGFALNVVDIDPAYTLGDMEARVAAIRKQLHDSGEAAMNLSLPAPPDFTRVAVIAPAEAAGLADFRALATRLEEAGLCAFEFFPAVFQGRDADVSIVKAYTSVYQRNCADREATGYDRYDLVVMIRGGGARGDLDWLNSLPIVRATARLPIPVWAGIGHNTDHVLIDEVAHTSFDTPSKVIHGIADRINAAALAAQDAYRAIVQVSQRRVERSQADVDAVFAQLSERASMVVERASAGTQREVAALGHAAHQYVAGTERAVAREGQALTQLAGAALATLTRAIDRAFDGIVATSVERVERAARAVREETETLVRESSAKIETAARNVQQWITQVVLVGPQKTLARGFAIVRDASGAPLARRADAERHTELNVEFADGILPVKHKEEGN